MKIIDRIYEYMAFKSLNAASLEKTVGLSNGYISKQNARKADIGEGVIIKILENCPDLNSGWLLTGEGEMLKDTYLPGSDNLIVNGNNHNVIHGNIHGNNSGINDGRSKVFGNSIELRLLKRENEHLKLLLVEKDKQLDGKDKQLTEKERIIELLMQNK